MQKPSLSNQARRFVGVSPEWGRARNLYSNKIRTSAFILI